MSIWNKITVMNPVQEKHLIYNYNLHKRQLGQITDKKTKSRRIDNQSPFLKPKTNKPQLGKFQRTRDLNIDIENGSLMHKMLEISTLPGEYNKGVVSKSIQLNGKQSMTLNMPHRMQVTQKVNEENTAIHGRLKKVKSTINFSQIKKDYKQQKKYSKNITHCSRRIYNCFLYNHNNSTQTQSNQSKMFKKSKQEVQATSRTQPNSPQPEQQDGETLGEKNNETEGENKQNNETEENQQEKKQEQEEGQQQQEEKEKEQENEKEKENKEETQEKPEKLET